jgi:hypothetical protein
MMEILKEIEANCGRLDKVLIISNFDRNSYSEDDDIGAFILANLNWFVNKYDITIDPVSDSDTKIEAVLDVLFTGSYDHLLVSELTFFKPTRIKYAGDELVSFKEGAGYTTPVMAPDFETLCKNALYICEKHFTASIEKSQAN